MVRTHQHWIKVKLEIVTLEIVHHPAQTHDNIDQGIDGERFTPVPLQKLPDPKRYQSCEDAVS